MNYKPKTKTILYAGLFVLVLWLILRATNGSTKKEGLTTQELDSISRDCQNEMNRVYNQMSASLKSIENYSRRVQNRINKSNKNNRNNPAPPMVIGGDEPTLTGTPGPDDWFTL